MNYFSGVLEDHRPEEEQKKDWYGEEVMSSTVRWKEKENLRSYPIWSQGSTGACVAFTFAKLVAIEFESKTGTWVDFSPAFIYLLRENATKPGMNIHNAANLVKDHGTTLEAILNSQNMTEEEINALDPNQTAFDMAEAISKVINSYLYLKPKADSVAQALHKGHGVGMILYANRDEYGDVPIVKDEGLKYAEADIRHMITLVDFYQDPDLGKCFRAEDSWGLGHGEGGRRVITEDFLEKRAVGLVYLDKFEFVPYYESEYEFEENLQFGDQGEEVEKLQNFLKDKGYFPINQESTGYYYTITAKAVLEWQIDNDVDDVETLKELQGHYFGPKSRGSI